MGPVPVSHNNGVTRQTLSADQTAARKDDKRRNEVEAEQNMQILRLQRFAVLEKPVESGLLTEGDIWDIGIVKFSETQEGFVFYCETRRGIVRNGYIVLESLSQPCFRAQSKPFLQKPGASLRTAKVELRLLDLLEKMNRDGWRLLGNSGNSWYAYTFGRESVPGIMATN